MERCCECGRFCIPADVGVYYGDSTMDEPPEDSIFCPKCAEKNMLKAINIPENISIKCWWIKPNYVSVANAIMRHKRRLTT